MGACFIPDTQRVQVHVQASVGPRSYNILLSERGAAALDQAGADLSGYDCPNVAVALRHK